MQKSEKTKKFEKAGYKIHFDRLRDIRPAASMIRTHKFKCAVSTKDAEDKLWDKFSEVGKVVDSSDKGSLMWFLIQLYGLGFLFVSKENGKKALLRKLYKIAVDEVESGSKYYQHIANEEAFQELMIKGFCNVRVNDADKAVRKHFWGIDAAIAVAVDAAQTSQTCRKCGRCATAEKDVEVKNASGPNKERLQGERDDIKRQQRMRNEEKPERGGSALFCCSICKESSDADEQAAQNIALKFYFKISDKFKVARETDNEIGEKKFYDKKNGKFLTTKFFLDESSRFAKKI